MIMVILMKRTSVLLLLLTVSGAYAASNTAAYFGNSTLTVTGVLTPDPCTVAFSGGATINYGTMDMGLITASATNAATAYSTTPTPWGNTLAGDVNAGVNVGPMMQPNSSSVPLPVRNTVLTVTCPAATSVYLSVTDTQASSLQTGLSMQYGEAAASGPAAMQVQNATTPTVANPIVSSATNAFGLGKYTTTTANDTNLGAYALVLGMGDVDGTRKYNATLPNVAGTSAGGSVTLVNGTQTYTAAQLSTTTTPVFGNSFQQGSVLNPDQSTLYTMVDATAGATTGPGSTSTAVSSGKTWNFPVYVYPTLLRNTTGPSTDTVTLNGHATFSVYYP
jgi:hypothetical protein